MSLHLYQDSELQKLFLLGNQTGFMPFSSCYKSLEMLLFHILLLNYKVLQAIKFERIQTKTEAVELYAAFNPCMSARPLLISFMLHIRKHIVPEIRNSRWTFWGDLECQRLVLLCFFFFPLVNDQITDQSSLQIQQESLNVIR